MPTAANPANLLIGAVSAFSIEGSPANESTPPAPATIRISRLAGLADIADSIAARQLADGLIQALVKKLIGQP